MKKNIVKFLSLILLLVGTTALFYGCKEDKSCKLVVVVKDVKDPSILIPKAKILIKKDPGNITREGISDSNGEAYFTFDNEAIFDIFVEKTDQTGYTRYGKSTVRLIPGETVTREVLLQL
jgi:hypothetical protein